MCLYKEIATDTLCQELKTPYKLDPVYLVALGCLLFFKSLLNCIVYLKVAERVGLSELISHTQNDNYMR